MSGHEKRVRSELKKVARQLRSASEDALSHEGSSFEKHSRYLRDLSGLCRRGLLRLAWNSLERRVEQQVLNDLRVHPAVEQFLNVARNAPVDELENLSRIILQELHQIDPNPLRSESSSGPQEPRFGKRDLPGRSPSLEEIPVEDSPSAPVAGGHRRPVSPSRSPVRRPERIKRSVLPPPPNPYGGVWDRSWKEIAQSATKFDKGQLWLVCPCEGCNRWFKQPSAFKQHLMHKQGQGNHMSVERFAQLDFNSLWDETWGEMEKLQKLRHDKATSAPVHSPRSASTKRPLEAPSDWPTDVPIPPPKTGPEEKKRMIDEGWMDPVPIAVAELLSFAAYQKANNVELDPEHWYEHIGPISDELTKELLEGHVKIACVHLDQVKDHDPLEFQLDINWGPDDILAYITSRVGMNFTSLGSKWNLTYRGSFINQEQQWLHFGAVFAPEGEAQGSVVGIQSLPREIQELAKHKGLIGLISSVVKRLAQVADPSRKRETRHGDGALPPAVVYVTEEIASAAAVPEYQDVVVEDLLAAAVAAEERIQKEDPQSFGQAGLGTGTPSPVETTRGYGTPPGHVNEIGKQEVQTGGDLGKGVLKDGKEDDGKTGEDTVPTVEPAHPHGESSTFGEPVHPHGGSSTMTSAGGNEVHGESGQPEHTASGAGGSPEEEVLKGLSPTVPFSATDGVVPQQMFQQVPPQTGFHVVRSDKAWARPPLDGYKGARVFVDGKVLRKGQYMASGVLGPVGFNDMCVGCGAVSNSFDTLWGYPFCGLCKGSCHSAAQARKMWRTQAAFISPLEEGTCFGQGGRSVDRGTDPRVIAYNILLDFKVVPVDCCAIRMNVHIRVLSIGTFEDRVCFEAQSIEHGQVATIVMDEWFRGKWIPCVGDNLWISGLSTWGSLEGKVVQFLFSPLAGVGIAKQPVYAGWHTPMRVLEIFAGIGGWGIACENVIGCTNVVSIDVDPNPCKLLAASRGIVPITVDQFLESGGVGSSQVIIGDVADPRWWFTTCLSDPFDLLFWSSPCVSFSKAGLRAGLASAEGALLLKAIGLRLVFGVFLSFGENVAGLLNHDHWPIILEFAKCFGHLTWNEFNLSVIAPMQRQRLFLAQSSDECDLDSKVVQKYFALVVQGIDIAPSLIDPAEAELLRVKREVLRFLADPELSVGNRVVTPADRETYGYGIAERTYRWPGDVLPVLMASHGRQHLLPRKLLQQNGLMAWVVADARIGVGTNALRTLHPFEALWLLGFDVFGPVNAFTENAMKPIGNTVSPWIAGAFVAAVFAAIGELKFLVSGQKWLKWAVGRNSLDGLRVFTRGECQWLGAGCPPSKPLGRVPWMLHWGHSFFLVKVDHEFLDNRFVQELCGFGKFWQCCFVITPAQPSQFALPLATIVGSSATVEIVTRGIFRIDPGDTVDSILARASLDPNLNKLTCGGEQPSRKTPGWALVDDQLRCQLEYQGPAPVFNHGARLIFRDEVHVVVIEPGVTLAQAIRIAWPFPCHAEGAEVWNVEHGRVVPVNETPKTRDGTFQVTLAPELFCIEPIGQIRFPPMSSIGECLTVLNGALYGSKASLMITAKGQTVEQDLSIGRAATRGVLRLKVYGLLGGGKPNITPLELSNKLSDLLAEKGVPKNAVEERTREVYQGLGTRILRQIFASREPWQALKQEATKEKLVLIGARERQPKEGGPTGSDLKKSEEPFDAWQAWLDNRNQIKHAKSKRREVIETTSFQLDMSFFKDAHGNKIGRATPEELLGGIAGIAVTQASEIGPLLPSFCTKNVTVGASAVVIIGGEVSAFGPRFQELIVPGWMNGKTVALKVAFLSTGDEPVCWDEAKKVCVDVATGNTVCLCFVYPVEAGDKWPVLHEGFDRYFKKIFPTAPEALIDHWAPSFYCKKRKVDPEQAEYFHVIVRINDKFLDSVLKSCGRNGLYLQPRSPTRGLDPRFGVVKLAGLTREEALTVQQQVPFQLGLVRTSKGFGLRVKTDKVREARKLVSPEAEVSSESGEDGVLRYRLLGVPEAFDRRSVKSMIGKLGWKAKVGKAVGWKTWLVSAGVTPPTKTIQVGDHTVVVAEETQSARQEVVVAATESRFKGLCADKANIAAVSSVDRVVVNDLGIQHTDKLQQVKEQVRDEVRLDLEKACNQRLDVLESAVEELKTSSVYQHNQTAAVQRDLAAVQQQVSGLPDQISALCKQLQQDSDSKLKELASEVKSSLRERDSTIGTQFDELKAMFEGATSAKTRRVADGL